MGLVLILGCWAGMAADGFPALFNGRSGGWPPVAAPFLPYFGSDRGVLCLAVPFEAVFEVLSDLDPLGCVAAFLHCVLLYLELFLVGEAFAPVLVVNFCSLPLFLIFSVLAPGLVDPSSFMGYRLFQILYFLSRAWGIRPGRHMEAPSFGGAYCGCCLESSALCAFFLSSLALLPPRHRPVKTCPNHRGVWERRSLPFSLPPRACSCLSVIEMNSPAAPACLFTAPSMISGKSRLMAALSCSGTTSVMLPTPTASIQWICLLEYSTPSRYTLTALSVYSSFTLFM